MGELLEKIKDTLLGTSYVDDEYGEGESENGGATTGRNPRDEAGEPYTVNGYSDPKVERNRKKEYDSNAKGPNVINFQNPQSGTRNLIMITRPKDVQDATSICEHVRNQKACVVILEGVERAKAQRIADFLGGVSFALDGEIERISNEIFMIAPASFHISADLKEELKAGSHFTSKASSYR